MIKIIDYRAPRCSPCKAFIPILERVTASLWIELVKINVEDEWVEIPLDLRSIPRIDIYKDWNFVTSNVWAINEDDLKELLFSI